MSEEKYLTLGAMSRSEAAVKLRELGDTKTADLLENFKAGATRSSKASISKLWPFQDKPWQYTAHAYGFIPAGKEETEQEISYAGGITPDKKLKNKQLKITLNELRVAEYPGGGAHHILFEFQA